eukprot:3805654-Prymnesium_polylepis.2
MTHTHPLSRAPRPAKGRAVPRSAAPALACPPSPCRLLGAPLFSNISGMVPRPEAAAAEEAAPLFSPCRLRGRVVTLAARRLFLPASGASSSTCSESSYSASCSPPSSSSSSSLSPPSPSSESERASAAGHRAWCRE